MKKLMETQPEVTEAAIQQVLNSDLSKSKKMIAMFDLGLETKEISDIMTKFEGKLVRYNFVYNVLSNHCMVNGVKVETAEKSGKKEQILEMFLAGKTNKEIAIDLKTNYNYVFNTVKQFKAVTPNWEELVAKPQATEQAAKAE